MAMRVRSIVFIACAVAGCGDYVRYDGAPPSTVAPGNLDEETIRVLEAADHFEHTLFEAVLASFVVPGADGDFVYVDYAALKDRPQSVLHLDRYLAEVAIVRPDNLATFEERLAYWIDAYNASVIRGVVEAYAPGYSVSVDNFQFFQSPRTGAGGEVWSLDQIEHGIIRGDETHDAFGSSDAATQARMRALHDSLWGDRAVDARIHVALNCAASSCPNLPSQAPFTYRPDRLEAQLDAAARAFADNAAKGAGPAGISRLFDWFAADWEPEFGGTEGFLRAHREDGLNGVDTGRFLEYDWSLNEPP